VSLQDRSEAKRGCEGGKVEVNGEHAKPHRICAKAIASASIAASARYQDVDRPHPDRPARQEVEARALYDDVTPKPTPEEIEIRAPSAIFRAAQQAAGTPDRRAGARSAAPRKALTVPRNQEVIRQWKVLHALETARHGVGIDALADELGVTTRTIRRDLAALQEAGFPALRREGRRRARALAARGPGAQGLETGFTLAELCALYLSRNLLESVAGAPFRRDLTMAFARIEKMLSPRMRQFLDAMPACWPPSPRRRRGGDAQADLMARLLEATLHHRVATMRYHSVSSGREKDYLIHPTASPSRRASSTCWRSCRSTTTSAPSP
jgi:ribosomal 50S subunit-recycling heat shock protein